MERKNKDNIIISFVAYMGNYPNQINLSQHFFGNVYISLEDYNRESNWENLKRKIANNVNKANAAEPGDSRFVYQENIAILNVLEN